MKYIIELGEEANMVQAINVTQNGTVYVGAKYVTELEELNADYINEHYGDLQDDAYERGHGIGYQKGLEDGKAIHENGCEGCKYQANRELTCPCSECSNNFKNQWTAKDDKIEVGDEVRRKHASENESRGIVTKDWKNSYYIMWTDGSSGQWDKDRVVKTGRHFDIEKILEAMRHD